MPDSDSPPTRDALTTSQRRVGQEMACLNGLLWAAGNGLASSTLVIYLALELGAEGLGLGVGMILAAPRIVGLLRAATPALIARLGNRKQFCIIAYLASAVVLLGLPVVAVPSLLPSALAPSPFVLLWTLVACWCVYHLLEYLGTVALWSWLADVARLRYRGRFLGIRQRWMVAGQAGAMLLAAQYDFFWRWTHSAEPGWLAYVVPAACGAVLMFLAVVPLAVMPHSSRPTERTRSPVASRLPSASLASMLAPISDRRFRRLLVYGCWFALFSGLTQAPQGMYPWRVLQLGLGAMLCLKIVMRGGQWLVSPLAGRWADRFGNRRILLVTLPLVSAGPLFYLAASPESPGWVMGAWVLWVAYAGMNVALPNLILKLSPSESSTAYLGIYFGVCGFCLAVGTIAGGWLTDRLEQMSITLLGGWLVLDHYQWSFLCGAITRTLACFWLWRVTEPVGE